MGRSSSSLFFFLIDFDPFFLRGGIGKWEIGAGGVGGGAVPADGRGAPGDGADAQGQLRRQERVRDDPELQGPPRRLQQTQDH